MCRMTDSPTYRIQLRSIENDFEQHVSSIRMGSEVFEVLILDVETEFVADHYSMDVRDEETLLSSFDWYFVPYRLIIYIILEMYVCRHYHYMSGSI